MFTRSLAITAITAVASSQLATAQTVVTIGPSATVGQSDITSGNINGQSFSLGPNTTFELIGNGRIGSLGNPPILFNLAESTVRMLDNSTIFGDWFVINANLEVEAGNVSLAASTFVQSEVSIAGGMINSTTGGLRFVNSIVEISGGQFISPLNFEAASATIFVDSASLDGTPLPLVDDVPFVVTQRGFSSLDLVLRDGSTLNLDLFPSSTGFLDFVSNDTTLTLVKGDIASSETITVESGQTLTLDDLAAGTFNGQSFTLGPNLVIDVVEDGEIDLVSSGFNSIDGDGTTINIREGGSLNGFDESLLTNVNYNIFPGGDSFIFEPGSGSIVNLVGGDIFSILIASGVTLNLESGVFSNIEVTNGGTLNVRGGFQGDPARTPFDRDISVFSGATVNVFAREASIDGTPLTLSTATPTEITQRGAASLDVALENGHLLSILLDDAPVGFFDDRFDANADLFITGVDVVPTSDVFAIDFSPRTSGGQSSFSETSTAAPTFSLFPSIDVDENGSQTDAFVIFASPTARSTGFENSPENSSARSFSFSNLDDLTQEINGQWRLIIDIDGEPTVYEYQVELAYTAPFDELPNLVTTSAFAERPLDTLDFQVIGGNAQFPNTDLSLTLNGSSSTPIETATLSGSDIQWSPTVPLPAGDTSFRLSVRFDDPAVDTTSLSVASITPLTPGAPSLSFSSPVEFSYTASIFALDMRRPSAVPGDINNSGTADSDDVGIVRDGFAGGRFASSSWEQPATSLDYYDLVAYLDILTGD